MQINFSKHANADNNIYFFQSADKTWKMIQVESTLALVGVYMQGQYTSNSRRKNPSEQYRLAEVFTDWLKAWDQQYHILWCTQ